jgi:hypothetical protein
MVPTRSIESYQRSFQRARRVPAVPTRMYYLFMGERIAIREIVEYGAAHWTTILLFTGEEVIIHSSGIIIH